MTNKRNSHGFAHHFIIPVLAIFAVGAIGVLTLNMSSAATTSRYCSGKTFGRYKNNPVYAKYDNYKVCVKAIQRKVGITGTAVDGYYGNHTQAKVKAWQIKYNKTHNPNLTTDGVVGTKTWGAMGQPTNSKKYPSATKRSCNAKGSKYEWKSSKCQKKATPAEGLSTSKPKTDYVTLYKKTYFKSEYPIYPTLISDAVKLDKNGSSYASKKSEIDRYNLVEADQQSRAKVRYNLTKNFLVKGSNSQDFNNDCKKYGGKIKIKEIPGDSKYFFPYQHSGKFSSSICGNS